MTLRIDRRSLFMDGCVIRVIINLLIIDGVKPLVIIHR